jgi:carbamoyltransferase
MTYILGISAYYHDSAAVILHDGQIIAAAQEERFSRKKHDASFPKQAIEYCLSEAKIIPEDIDFVAYYDKPFLKFERLLQTYLAYAPKGFKSFLIAMPLWLREKLFLKNLLISELHKIASKVTWIDKLRFCEHHLSHAASAYYPSPYEEALVLTMDGVGEWATTSVAIGKRKDLKIVKEIHFPHSLGLLYSAFTFYLGFKINSGEYKVMGLAPYGQPKYVDLIFNHLIDLKEDGSFRLDQSYFDYCVGLVMIRPKFSKLFGQPPRQPSDLLSQFHMDIASSIQAALERIVVQLTRSIRSEFGIDNLCLAGGVALNCVANGKILNDSSYSNIWIQPAAGDAGGALGAAFSIYHLDLGNERHVNHADLMMGSYLGPSFDQQDIETRLSAIGANFTVLTFEQIIDQTVVAISAGDAVGWFQDRMEFGPRALGNRSILGDARSPKMQSVLNIKVKNRESFRPFAPAVLNEDVSEWFNITCKSPYMLYVTTVHKNHWKKHIGDLSEQDSMLDRLREIRSSIPAITHVDYSARVQTVHIETNPKFHQLISNFKKVTNVPVIINTSFNVRGEPIVCSPEDAFRCFMGTEIDVLVIGNCYLKKQQQPEKLKFSYLSEFDLD